MNVTWSFPTRVAAALLALLIVGVCPAAAQTPSAAVADTIPLSLEEAQRLSLRQNPQFLAESREGAIARGQLRQARLPAFNPQASLELPAVATGGGAGEYEASLTQEVEWAGQRGARVRAAGFGVQRADLTVRNAARITLGDVSNAYFDTYAARQRLQLAEELLDLNEQLLRAVRIQLREGEVSALEANLAEVELGRARARVLAARRELTSAELQLKRLIGLSPDQPIRLPGAVPAAAPAPATGRDSLVALALGRRPDLVAQRTAVLESRALSDLARREGRPNVAVGVLARREGDGGDPQVGLGVSVPFPILNRNQGRLAEQQARTSQAELQARAVELAVRTEVTDALRTYQTATEEETVYASSVLQPTRENRALLETAYREGKIDLATLLLMRNQLLDAELGYWDTWQAQRRAQVFLEVATGASPVLADIDDTTGDTDND
jgi:cobalt-zinc-cadmium efflux system outer membrane protein